jgi:uncharacterized RDD family membrane protein YckC
MNDQILDSPVGQERHLEYAGFWIRVGAYFIDFILLSIINIILSYIIAGGYDPMQSNPMVTIVSLVVNLSYFIVMESSEKQGTLGKMAVGVKVVDANGDRISVGAAVGRYFAKILSGLILLIGFMMVGWDDKKQGLHDKLAGTYVIYK